MPDAHQKFARRWRELHPGWSYCLWDEQTITGVPLVNRWVYDEAGWIAPGSEGQLRADVVRYEVLRQMGGVYIDTDMEPLRSIEPLLERCDAQGLTCFAGWEHPQKWINNAVFGCVSEHPLLCALVDGLAANVRAKAAPGVRPNVLSGPQFLTHTFNGDRELQRNVVIYPRHYFYPYNWNELHRSRESFPDSYAVHHWQNQRKKRGVPL